MQAMHDATVPTVVLSELEADPHGLFCHYRPLTPVIARETGGLLVLRASDVDRLMRSPAVRQPETELLAERGITGGALFDLARFGMLTSNGPDHRRRRAPFTRMFAAAMIAALRPAIRQGATALMDEWHSEPGVDLVESYAAQLPARTIAAMLGLPGEDIARFTRLVYSVSRLFSFTSAPGEMAEIEADAAALLDYVDVLLTRRRQAPADDFLSGFVADADAKGELSALEIVVQVVTLIIGGTDTTRVAMASQVALLLQHREQWDAVQAEPGLVRSAVAEALRFEPSVASVGRVVLEDVELGDLVIPAGQFLSLSTMSAFRDPAAYDRPDAFDIRRTDGRRLHPVFGGGVHRCLGEALAWAELEEGLSALATRLPGLRLAADLPELRGHMGIRRIGPMHVTW